MPFANGYQTTTTGSLTSGATSVTVASTTGIPALPFTATIVAEGANTDEIVQVTANAAGTLTLVRGYELMAGNGASAHASGATFAATVTAGFANAVGMILIEEHTASSSAQLDFTTFISSTYDNYAIEGVDLLLQTSTASLYLEVGTGGGPTWDTGSNYEWAWAGLTTGGGASNTAGSTGIAPLLVNVSNNSVYGVAQFSLRAMGLQSTTARKTFFGTRHEVDSGPASAFQVGGIQWTTSGTAATGLRFIPSSGNIVSGVIRIYGIAKS